MMATIPGHATEIRYARTGPLAGKYYHRFGPGVRMRANADGSVTLRGRRRIHATEDEPGFWRKYGGRHHANPRRRRATPRSRRQVVVLERETSGLPWGWIFAGVFFWTWSLNRGAVASVTAPGDVTPYVSLSDVVRGMQAEAETLAATAEADGTSYVSLSDWVRSGGSSW